MNSNLFVELNNRRNFKTSALNCCTLTGTSTPAKTLIKLKYGILGRALTCNVKRRVLFEVYVSWPLASGTWKFVKILPAVDVLFRNYGSFQRVVCYLEIVVFIHQFPKRSYTEQICSVARYKTVLKQLVWNGLELKVENFSQLRSWNTLTWKALWYQSSCFNIYLFLPPSVENVSLHSVYNGGLLANC